MTKYASILVVLVMTLFVYTETQAGIVITNTQPCAYTATLYMAPIGSCATIAPVPVAVPPFSVAAFPCPAGFTVVGVCVQEVFPAIFPAGGGCIGLAGPPCAGFPLGIAAFGSCGMPVVFTPGFPAALNF